MDGADVFWNCGGSKRTMAVERYGGPNVTSDNKRCAKRSGRDERILKVLFRGFLRSTTTVAIFIFQFGCLGEDEDSNLEKQSLEVSPIGLKIIRAANEPNDHRIKRWITS